MRRRADEIEPPRAIPTVARVCAAAYLALGLIGCGPDGRLGAAGETCGRTADCAAPMRCVDARCTSPDHARQLLDARRGPAAPATAPAVAGGRAPLGIPPTDPGSAITPPATARPAGHPGGGPSPDANDPQGDPGGAR